MTRIRLAISAAALTLTPFGALAQDGLQWGAVTELAADPFQSIIVLAHGVPGRGTSHGLCALNPSLDSHLLLSLPVLGGHSAC